MKTFLTAGNNKRNFPLYHFPGLVWSFPGNILKLFQGCKNSVSWHERMSLLPCCNGIIDDSVYCIFPTQGSFFLVFIYLAISCDWNIHMLHFSLPDPFHANSVFFTKPIWNGLVVYPLTIKLLIPCITQSTFPGIRILCVVNKSA